MVWQMQHFYVIQQYPISNSNPANIFPLVSVETLNSFSKAWRVYPSWGCKREGLTVRVNYTLQFQVLKQLIVSLEKKIRAQETMAVQLK